VRILDLGCGNGSLLKLLGEEKNVKGLGLEISEKKILECVSNGVPVVHADLDEGLREFADKSFDFVVLSQTLQALLRPDKALEEMVRVGKKGIISLINLGYFKARLQLTFNGQMPVTKTLPMKWYNTENTHLSTIWDFRNLCKERNIRILEEIPLGHKNNTLANLWPNIFAPTCVFVIAQSD
jgi:methionine biosynthesis protein MetW